MTQCRLRVSVFVSRRLNTNLVILGLGPRLAKMLSVTSPTISC